MGGSTIIIVNLFVKLCTFPTSVAPWGKKLISSTCGASLGSSNYVTREKTEAHTAVQYVGNFVWLVWLLAYDFRTVTLQKV